jgi:signal transduction histidine kinase
MADQRAGRLRDPFVCIRISDNGPGLPPDVQDHLFEKFVTSSQKQKGSGLGLTFCKLVVEAHGGEIYAESNPVKGTDFVLTLPLTPEP